MARVLPDRRRSAAAALTVVLLGACASAERATAPDVGVRDIAAPPARVVVSQVYGGGGNAGATLRNDFIELYNAGTTAVSLAGWSVQYASATGTSWAVTPLGGTIEPGRYYLVQQAAGTGGTQDLPTPDAVGSISMSGSAGKVVLANSTTAFTVSCPTAASAAVDFVGYGGANCFEGSAPTPALSNTTAALRRDDGRTDTNDNRADFATGAPAPRNSGVGSTPTGPITSVVVTPATVNVAAGATVQLSARATDAAGNAVASTFTWTSGTPAVATVSSTGLVGGVAASATPVTITATAPNGVVGTAAVTVTAAGPTTFTRATFSTTTNDFPVGFQAQLFSTPFVGPTSSDTVPQSRYTRRYEAVTPGVATIDAVTGVITGVGAGTARFRAVFTPNDGGAVFSAEGGTVTIEAREEADSASTYGNNLEFGRPAPLGGSEAFPILRRQFASSWNARLGQPNWVSYQFDSRQQGGEDRCNCFTTDPLTVAAGLPAVTTADYVGSGYSRGHMTRSADRTRTNVENAATFYLTNIVPQIQDQNGGPWAALESVIGDSVRAGRAAYVITGPQFNDPANPRTLNNAGRVAIPDSTWKVVLIVGREPGTGRPRGVADLRTAADFADVTVIAVMMPNSRFSEGLVSDWRVYRRSVDQVEAVTGFDFLNALPPAQQAYLEAQGAGVRAVAADVQPEVIGLTSTAVVNVVVYGTASFDAAALVAADLRLVVNGTGTGVAPITRGTTVNSTVRDVDGDGRLDRVTGFATSALRAAGLAAGPANLVLRTAAASPAWLGFDLAPATVVP